MTFRFPQYNSPTRKQFFHTNLRPSAIVAGGLSITHVKEIGNLGSEVKVAYFYVL